MAKVNQRVEELRRLLTDSKTGQLVTPERREILELDIVKLAERLKQGTLKPTRVLEAYQVNTAVVNCVSGFIKVGQMQRLSEECHLFSRDSGMTTTEPGKNCKSYKIASPVMIIGAQLERPANIRIIRIFEYNFTCACIRLSEYEANGYCQQERAFKSSIFEQNPSTFG